MVKTPKYNLDAYHGNGNRVRKKVGWKVGKLVSDYEAKIKWQNPDISPGRQVESTRPKVIDFLSSTSRPDSYATVTAATQRSQIQTEFGPVSQPHTRRQPEVSIDDAPNGEPSREVELDISSSDWPNLTAVGIFIIFALFVWKHILVPTVQCRDIVVNVIPVAINFPSASLVTFTGVLILVGVAINLLGELSSPPRYMTRGTQTDNRVPRERCAGPVQCSDAQDHIVYPESDTGICTHQFVAINKETVV